MSERILDGSLRAISTPDLLTFINLIKKTGTLTLQQGDNTQKIFWERGEIIFASSSDPEVSLGSFLVRHGKITPEQNMKSGLQVEPGKRQGRILVQMGILTPKALWWAVKNQVLEIIYSVFTARDGWFYFEETEETYGEKIKLSTSTTNIVMEGIRRLDEWPRIKEILPNDRIVPRLAPKEKRDKTVKFLEAEEAILSLVDNERTVRDIIYLSNMEEFETLRLLMAFVLARYVQVPEGSNGAAVDEVEDSQALDTVVESFNAVFSQIGAYLAVHLTPMAVAGLMERALASSESPVLDGLSFDGECRLDPRSLTANVAEVRVEERIKALEGGLNHLLSFLLFEASKHLDPEEKSALYRRVGDLSSAAR